MNRLLRTGSSVVFALLTVAGLLSVGAGAAAAAGNPPTFTVSVLPSSLTVGKSGVVQGTFTNNGTAVSGVAFTFTFPFAVSVPAANGCASILPKTVGCIVGLVGSGEKASKAFQFTVPAASNLPALPDSIAVNGVAGWLSPAPPRAGLAKTNGTATIYPAGSTAVVPLPTVGGFEALSGASDCVGQAGNVDGTFTGTFEGVSGVEGPVVTAGPNSVGLPCTPIVAGVVQDSAGNDQLVAKLPLGTTATVTLYFGDEQLPWPSGLPPWSGSRDTDAPQHLYEYPNYPDLTGQVEVPVCTNGVIPSGHDACIVSVTSTDTGDNDNDAGYMVLNVVGSAGDGAFHGG